MKAPQRVDQDIRYPRLVNAHPPLVDAKGNEVVSAENLTLEQTQRKLKTLSKVALGMASLRWQRNFFDYRLRRPEETMEDFARYIFMNPYRKALVSPKELWPWWVVNRHYRPAFLDALNGGAHPPPQWIGETPSARDLTSHPQ